MGRSLVTPSRMSYSPRNVPAHRCWQLSATMAITVASWHHALGRVNPTPCHWCPHGLCAAHQPWHQITSAPEWGPRLPGSRWQLAATPHAGAMPAAPDARDQNSRPTLPAARPLRCAQDREWDETPPSPPVHRVPEGGRSGEEKARVRAAEQL